MNIFEAQVQHVREDVAQKASPDLAQQVRNWALMGTLAAGLMLGSADRSQAQEAVELSPLPEQVENQLNEDYTYRMVAQEMKKLEAKVLEVQSNPDATPSEKRKALKLAEIFADHYLPTVRGTPAAQHAVHASMARMAAGVGDLERLSQSIEALEALEGDIPTQQLARLLDAKVKLLEKHLAVSADSDATDTQKRLNTQAERAEYRAALEQAQHRRAQLASGPEQGRTR